MKRPGMAAEITLDNRKIGKGNPVFIIAEIGVNHNGDLELARKMVDVAAECGADCVKLQTFRAEEFMSDRSLDYEYENGGKKVRENMFTMFKRLELPASWHLDLMERARKLGMVAITTVTDALSADLADEAGMPGFKLASSDLINLPLIERVASKRKPIIISTGMADEEELRDALAVLEKHGNRQAVFLHCVSVYPTPDPEVKLARMLALAQVVGDNVGFSDHSIGIEACVGAVAMGATVLEKHFTLDRNLPGPDHSLSSDPVEFAALVKAVRRMEAMKGEISLEPSATEKENLKVFRRSIVTARDLPAGHVLVRDDLYLKRPGDGLKAAQMPALLGRALKNAVPKDTPLSLEMIR
jgi:N,N'-diacetyllegionaminate synthase